MESPVVLLPGDHAPWFHAPVLDEQPAAAFDTAAGRYVMMLFFASASFEPSKRALGKLLEHRALFDDKKACFFGVCIDPQDVQKQLIASQIPGIHFFLDYDRTVSKLFGVLSANRYQPRWLLLDPGLRVVEQFLLEHGDAAINRLRAELASDTREGWAPSLLIPNVLEPRLCRQLIEAYERDGGRVSGFMRDVDGKTVLLVDPSHKRRRDYTIEDEALRLGIAARLRRRLNPAVKRAFQFEATRIERYLVACYDAAGGYFRPHRDNTTNGTAHRRFAVTLNLNAEDYEGGDLRFPEFGQRTYRAPTGGALVFSCSLLHEATAVTSGRRYAFLPFLYDEEAARLREANNPNLGEGIRPYHKGGVAAVPEGKDVASDQSS